MQSRTSIAILHLLTLKVEHLPITHAVSLPGLGTFRKSPPNKAMGWWSNLTLKDKVALIQGGLMRWRYVCPLRRVMAGTNSICTISIQSTCRPAAKGWSIMHVIWKILVKKRLFVIASYPQFSSDMYSNKMWTTYPVLFPAVKDYQAHTRKIMSQICT